MDLLPNSVILWMLIMCVVLSLVMVISLLWPILLSYVSPKGRHIRKLINKIPGPPSLPLVGNALEFLVSREKVVEVRTKHFSCYSKIFKIWTFHRPLVKPVDPAYIEAILHSSQNIEKSVFYKLLHPWLGTGLLTSSGAKWFLHRKLLTPTFHFKILEDFVPLFIEKSASLVKKLTREIKPGESFDIVPVISQCTLDLICESAMGIKLDRQDEVQQEYVSAIYTLGDIVYYRSMRPWLMIDWLFSVTEKAKLQEKALKTLHQFTEQVIREKKNEYLLKRGQGMREMETRSKKRKVKAFLDLLIELSVDENLLSEKEIREEVDTFMFEGHDTTSMAICWTLFLLANNPEIQENVWEEVDSAWKQKNNHNGEEDSEFSVKFFNDMSYLDRCIKESLRLYPSVPVISREITNDLQMGEFLVPTETIIHIHVNNIHRNPLIYQDPNTFDPDRFLPEAVSCRHPYAYIPFSAGPRNCIGQRFAMLEVKAVVSSLVHNFHITAVDKPEDIVIIADLVLRSKNGIRIKLEPRKKFE